ncbi:hypothetical protein TRFO_21218 [Tritrichomonas foetus]|uniref:FERM domain-containing protein n=1 Tax=Tritrichomonas foetus TaxID=1144522 RepID=A0A1J4KFS6_9EUKA|nr:hypothetical protein TRFO_21218 [Tritrichomonas foetus]|eukprot:OHT09784.1 hypothetical protein TRFO_21218 [Tritrichomonas foetus]
MSLQLCIRPRPRSNVKVTILVNYTMTPRDVIPMLRVQSQFVKNNQYGLMLSNIRNRCRWMPEDQEFGTIVMNEHDVIFIQPYYKVITVELPDKRSIKMKVNVREPTEEIVKELCRNFRIWPYEIWGAFMDARGENILIIPNQSISEQAPDLQKLYLKQCIFPNNLKREFLRPLQLYLAQYREMAIHKQFGNEETDQIILKGKEWYVNKDMKIMMARSEIDVKEEFDMFFSLKTFGEISFMVRFHETTGPEKHHTEEVIRLLTISKNSIIVSDPEDNKMYMSRPFLTVKAVGVTEGIVRYTFGDDQEWHITSHRFSEIAFIMCQLMKKFNFIPPPIDSRFSNITFVKCYQAFQPHIYYIPNDVYTTDDLIRDNFIALVQSYSKIVKLRNEGKIDNEYSNEEIKIHTCLDELMSVLKTKEDQGLKELLNTTAVNAVKIDAPSYEDPSNKLYLVEKNLMKLNERIYKDNTNPMFRLIKRTIYTSHPQQKESSPQLAEKMIAKKMIQIINSKNPSKEKDAWDTIERCVDLAAEENGNLDPDYINDLKLDVSSRPKYVKKQLAKIVSNIAQSEDPNMDITHYSKSVHTRKKTEDLFDDYEEDSEESSDYYINSSQYRSMNKNRKMKRSQPVPILSQGNNSSFNLNRSLNTSTPKYKQLKKNKISRSSFFSPTALLHNEYDEEKTEVFLSSAETSHEIFNLSQCHHNDPHTDIQNNSSSLLTLNPNLKDRFINGSEAVDGISGENNQMPSNISDNNNQNTNSNSSIEASTMIDDYSIHDTEINSVSVSQPTKISTTIEKTNNIDPKEIQTSSDFQKNELQQNTTSNVLIDKVIKNETMEQPSRSILISAQEQEAVQKGLPVVDVESAEYNSLDEESSDELKIVSPIRMNDKKDKIKSSNDQFSPSKKKYESTSSLKFVTLEQNENDSHISSSLLTEPVNKVSTFSMDQSDCKLNRHRNGKRRKTDFIEIPKNMKMHSSDCSDTDIKRPKQRKSYTPVQTRKMKRKFYSSEGSSDSESNFSDGMDYHHKHFRKKKENKQICLFNTDNDKKWNNNQPYGYPSPQPEQFPYQPLYQTQQIPVPCFPQMAPQFTPYQQTLMTAYPQSPGIYPPSAATSPNTHVESSPQITVCVGEKQKKKDKKIKKLENSIGDLTKQINTLHKKRKSTSSSSESSSDEQNESESDEYYERKGKRSEIKNSSNKKRRNLNDIISEIEETVQKMINETNSGRKAQKEIKALAKLLAEFKKLCPDENKSSKIQELIEKAKKMATNGQNKKQIFYSFAEEINQLISFNYEEIEKTIHDADVRETDEIIKIPGENEHTDDLQFTLQKLQSSFTGAQLSSLLQSGT